MGTVEKIFQKGDLIIREGHFSNSFYVILEGSVEVVKRKGEQEVQLAVLKEPEFFGEMSLLDPDHSMHSATIRALEPTKITIMDKDDFDRYIGTLTPGMRNLLTKLVNRLRETSNKVAGQEDEITGSAPAQPPEQESVQAEGESQPEAEKPTQEEDSQQEQAIEGAAGQPVEQESARAEGESQPEAEKPTQEEDSQQEQAIEGAAGQPAEQESAQAAEESQPEVEKPSQEEDSEENKKAGEEEQ
jgi:CRP-like cAMP-binding protein